jgi:biotin operon repressor
MSEDASLIQRAERGDHLSATDLLRLAQVAPDVYIRYLKREREQTKDSANLGLPEKNCGLAPAETQSDFHNPSVPHVERHARIDRNHLRPIADALRGRRAKFNALLTYIALRSYANPKGEAFPSLLALAEDLGLSVNTVSKSVQTLSSAGCAKIFRRRRTSNFYRLESPPFVESNSALDSSQSTFDSPTSECQDSPPGFTLTKNLTKNIKQRSKLKSPDEDIEEGTL